MATITQNNVNFNNVSVGSGAFNGWGTKYTNSLNLLDGKYDPDPENIEKSFNAIEIDWNGAQTNHPTYKTLNTTGQFCALLNDLAKRVTNIENKANNINYSINITPSNLIIYTNASPSSIQLTCKVIQN